MSEQENTTNVPDSGENTQTRKTVRLKVPTAPVTAKMAVPGQAPAAGAPSAPIADPLSGRDTDTGNLDILSDTQTRKTVKLKPLSAAAENRPINIPGASPAPAPAPAAPAPAPAAPAAPAAEASTNTRKVLVLKPTPVKHTPVNPLAPEVSPSKQTMVLSQESEAEKPAVDPAKQTMVLEQSGDSDDTVKVKKVDAPATPGIAAVEESDDKTVKVQRPARPTITPAPAPAAAPATPVAATAVTPDEDKATVKLARPAIPKPAAPAPAAAPVAAPAPAPAPVVVEETPAEEPKAEEAPAPEAPKRLSLKKDKDEAKAAPPQVAAGMAALGLSESGTIDGAQLPKQAAAPSMLYTVIAAITLLLLIASAALSTVQYLNYQQGMNIELPIPGAK